MPLQLSPGKPYASVQGAHSQVITLLGFQGRILRTRPSSWITGAYAYAATEDWLSGGLGELDEVEAATELARRWLRRFGPGTTRTCSGGWAGRLGLTRRALEGCGAVPVALDSGPGWIAADDEPVDDAEPWVALLPALDPTTMGWKQRSWYLPEAAIEAFDSVGNGGPTIWVDGRIVGAWAQDKRGEVHLHYFEKVAAGRRREIDARVSRPQEHGGHDPLRRTLPRQHPRPHPRLTVPVVTRCSLRAEDSSSRSAPRQSTQRVTSSEVTTARRERQAFRRAQRGRLRRERPRSGAPGSVWTEERADTLFVCERGRKTEPIGAQRSSE